MGCAESFPFCIPVLKTLNQILRVSERILEKEQRERVVLPAICNKSKPISSYLLINISCNRNYAGFQVTISEIPPNRWCPDELSTDHLIICGTTNWRRRALSRGSQETFQLTILLGEEQSVDKFLGLYLPFAKGRQIVWQDSCNTGYWQ